MEEFSGPYFIPSNINRVAGDEMIPPARGVSQPFVVLETIIVPAECVPRFSVAARKCAICLGLGSNPGEDMDVCKCIVPLRYGATLNSRRVASPLVWLVEGEERWEVSDHPQSILPLNWGGTKPNRTVTCMVLKALAK
ncbi:uncharacterized protein TNCV_1828931 [Trichonephila clavipes]|nr:uncharacterized protein TNCV_1828931 [Trichonephila clavipes]